jgi:hypothetical protein
MSLGAVLLASAGYIGKNIFWPSPLSSFEGETLDVYLDTLIPSDTTPGAVELGVSRKMLSRAFEDKDYRILMRKGCKWLNRKAEETGAQGFTELDEKERDRIVGLASEANRKSPERTFLELTQHQAFSHYYAHPQGFARPGYHGAPQPEGYPAYASRPALRPS